MAKLRGEAIVLPPLDYGAHVMDALMRMGPVRNDGFGPRSVD